LNFLKLKPSKVHTRSKKRHAHFQTPSDFRGVLNQIFATTKTYSTCGFTHRNHSCKNNNQKRTNHLLR
jgi:hypothetical protein